MSERKARFSGVSSTIRIMGPSRSHAAGSPAIGEAAIVVCASRVRAARESVKFMLEFP
ncbi:hypothetical protein BCEN4_40058 [Burkholderia cenocepacia]|nr:hypothetical protein BCEN4_40058 [Burkholderia cenocepacia]